MTRRALAPVAWAKASEHWPQTLTAVTLWVVLAAAIGISRRLRRQVT